MTTPRDPETEARKPARSVETFDDRSRAPATSGVVLLVVLAILALIAIFVVVGLVQ